MLGAQRLVFAEDASATWFNPAGIDRLDSQLQASGSYIMPSFKSADRNSVQETPVALLPLCMALPFIVGCLPSSKYASSTNSVENIDRR